jgi:phosphomannomutase
MPGGTQPKLKCYVEVMVPVGGDKPVGQARARAHRELEALTSAIATATDLG